MPAPTTRRLAAVLTAAMVAMLLAVSAGTARAAGSAAPIVGAVQQDDHHAVHPRIADGSDQADHALDLAAAAPGPDSVSLGVVADDRGTRPDATRGVDPVTDSSRGPPGR